MVNGYADDTNARKTFPLHFQFDIIHNKIPIVIISITNWMYMFLKINLDKTEIIYFIPKSLKHCNTVNGVIVPGIGCIRFSDVVKNLGVHLREEHFRPLFLALLVEWEKRQKASTNVLP